MKMKWFATVILMFGFTAVLAQNKTIKYCEVFTQVIGVSGDKLKVELVTGKVDSLSFIRDPNSLRKLQKVITLQTTPDILSYMGIVGWSVVSITSPSTGATHFFFKNEVEN